MLIIILGLHGQYCALNYESYVFYLKSLTYLGKCYLLWIMNMNFETCVKPICNTGIVSLLHFLMNLGGFVVRYC